jgi:uncharacterized protein
MRDVALVIIARAPELGRVKSRLAVSIGDAQALVVYRQLLAIVAQVSANWNGPVLLSATGAPRAWENTGLESLPRHNQPDGGLGTRIHAALEKGLHAARTAIAIGTDCPALTCEHLRSVVSLIGDDPVAFGPANDGGYWSVAVNRGDVLPILGDERLPWSQPTLLAASEQALTSAGFSSRRGNTLADLDDLADLSAASNAGHVPALNASKKVAP